MIELDIFNLNVVKMECWWWVGYRDKNGYGKIGIGGKGWRSNRLAYFLFNGPIPKNIWVLHTCNNTSCCNPAHLYLGTPKENTQDLMQTGKHRSQNQRGENNSYNKLTEQDAVIIFNGLKEGMLGKDLATYFSITPSNITAIKKGKTFSYLFDNHEIDKLNSKKEVASLILKDLK